MALIGLMSHFFHGSIFPLCPDQSSPSILLPSDQSTRKEKCKALFDNMSNTVQLD
jgi:hypothetical protein